MKKVKKDKVKLINFISNVAFSRQELNEAKDLFHYLRLFRYMPNSYLMPQKSITLLCTFIYGYLTAIFKLESEFEQTNNLLWEFDKYVGIERSWFSHGIYSYAKHFLNKCNGDEEKAFDLFFALLEEFKLEKEDLNNE